MNRGKNICDKLKAIRQKIADENGINYIANECKFTGQCNGTCPTCEAETKWLEHQLAINKSLGLPLKIAGVALALCSTPPTLAQTEHDTTNINQNEILKTVDLSFGSNEKIKISGIVTDENNIPLIGATLTVIYPEQNKQNGTLTNLNGAYSIILPNKAKIKFQYIGYESKVLTTCDLTKNSKVTLRQDTQTLMGEIIVTNNCINSNNNKQNK